MPEIDQLIIQSEELALKHEKLHAELVDMLMSDPNVSEDFKSKILEDELKHQKEREMFEDYLRANRGREIKGIDLQTFIPIFGTERKDK